MPSTRWFESAIRELRGRLPLSFRWYSGPEHPAVAARELVLMEDLDDDVGKILMRRSGRTYVFTSYLSDPSSGSEVVTIMPDAHAHRHATGNSTKSDVGDDPLAPYSFVWEDQHEFAPTSDLVPVKITANAAQTEDLFQIQESSFDPSSIANLEVWYKFDEISGTDKQDLPEDTTITDSSGNGNTGTIKTGGASPSIRLRTNFQNGLNVLETIDDSGSRFDGWILVNDGAHPTIATTVAGGGPDDPEWEAFFVIRRAGVNTLQDNVLLRTRSSAEDTNDRNLFAALASGSGLQTGKITYGGLVVAAVSPLSTQTTGKDTWSIHSINRNSAHQHEYRINGTDVTSGTPTAEGGNFVLRSILATADAGGLESGFSGQIGEFLIFSEKLSTADRNSVIDYLKTKWGIGTSGGSGTPDTLVVVDSAGKVGIGSGLDPSIRLHVKDAAAVQLRLEEDASNYTDIRSTVKTDGSGSTLITSGSTNPTLTIPNAANSGFSYTAFGDDADSTILSTIAGVVRVRGTIGGAQVGLYGDANINAAFSMRGDADGDQWTIFTDRATDGQLTFKQHAGPAGARDVNVLTLRDTGSAGEAKFWYDASNYATLTIPSDGEVQFNVQGGDPNYRFRSADVTIVRLIAPNIISGPGVPPDDTAPESSGLQFYTFNTDGPMGAINPAFVFDHISGANTGNLMLFKEASSAVAAIKKTGVIMGFGLGIGLGTTAATAPGAKAEIRFTSEQLRLSYNSTNRMSITVGSAGSTTFALTGTSPEFTFSQEVNFTNGISLGATSNRIDSNVADADETANVLIQPTTTFTLSDTRYLAQIKNSAGTSRFQFTTNGNLYLNTGGVFTGGVTKAIMATNGSYFNKLTTGVISGTRTAAQLQANVRPDTGSSGINAIGVACTSFWDNAGSYTGVLTFLRGGQFQATTNKANGGSTNFLQGGSFIASATANFGTGHTIFNQHAGYFAVQMSGAAATITEAVGLYVETPTGLGAGTTLARGYGVLIKDQKGLGTLNQALQINSQTGSSATKGNVYCAGGDWNNGHIQLGAAHIWFDGTNIRGKASAPTSAGDGTVIV